MADANAAAGLLANVRLVHGRDTCDDAGRPLGVFTCDYHQGYEDGLAEQRGGHVTSDSDTPAGAAAALDAVRRLHVKVFDGYLGQDVCAHCSDDDGRWATWPCRTIATIEES